jgi:hypothetical protein
MGRCLYLAAVQYRLYKEKPGMELKATLKDYTEPEFQALVNRIWAVDIPRCQDSCRLSGFS